MGRIDITCLFLIWAAKGGAGGPDLTAMQQNLEYYDWNIGKLFGTPWATAAEQTQNCSHLGVLLSAGVT